VTGTREGGGPAIPAIGDYALIGDCRSAGLVSREGSLDWLCFPRFDSPSVFAAILDHERGGCFRIRPTGPFRTERRYMPGTNIVETTFHGANGTFVVRDVMPVSSEEAKRRQLRPEHEVLRQVEGLAGEVEIEIVYQPRPDYGRAEPNLVDRGPLGICCEALLGLLVLRSELPLNVHPDCTARGTATVRAGESYFFALTYEEDGPATLPLLGASALARLQESAAWWRGWIDRLTYRGPYQDAVSRSALTLKLLAFAPSGAIVAAPTTSLPEKIGGPRNWDYRYCWLRDASFTVRALLSLGFDEEAEAFLGWILHATRLSWPKLQVLYSVYGETRLPERELEHLRGHRDSSPVRIGNDAHGQLQLDVYGEVIDAAAQFALRGLPFDADTRHLLNTLGETVCRTWRQADEGLWEGRAGRFQHTHSKVLCWVALDRLLTLHEAGLLDADVARLTSERDSLRTVIERSGFNDDLGAYTGTLDGDQLDASLLTLPLYGYADAGSSRMRSTLDRILRDLGDNGLIYRYDSSTSDGLPPGEGTFGICSFWAVECLAKAGDAAEASAMFERVLLCQNDLGLLAEEIDPRTDAALGNFPQAFTHVGLINAAVAIAASYEPPGRSREPVGNNPVGATG
jgi:GH15 family glucan-1,4-alpha-glucosidase